MSIPTFAKVAGELDRLEHGAEYQCLDAPRGVRCPNRIPPDRIEGALTMIHQDTRRLNEQDKVRRIKEIIAALVCEQQQLNSRYDAKNRVRDQWQREFPDLDFTIRVKCKYSLSPQTSPNLSRRTSQQPSTPTRNGRLSTPVDSGALSNEAESPLAGPSRRRHGSEHALGPSTPTIVLQQVDEQLEREGGLSSTSEDDSSEEMVSEQSEAVDEPISQDSVTEDEQMQDDAAPVDVPAGPSATLGSDPQNVNSTNAESSTELAQSSPQSTGRSPAGEFVPGDASSWSPWTIRTRVRDLVLDPLPKPGDKGCIYVLQNTEHTHVKIGYTMRDYEDRRAEIARTHAISLDKNTDWHLPGVPYIQLLRLEQLVHADLACFQRDRPVRIGGDRRTRREWFEVDLDIAVATVNLWWQIMQQNGMIPGQELDSDVCYDLQTSAAFDPQALVGSDEAVSFAELNGNHASRIEMWKELLLPERSRSRSKKAPSTFLIWVTGCVVVCILPSAFELDERSGSFLLAAALAVWTQYMYAT